MGGAKASKHPDHCVVALFLNIQNQWIYTGPVYRTLWIQVKVVPVIGPVFAVGVQRKMNAVPKGPGGQAGAALKKRQILQAFCNGQGNNVLKVTAGQKGTLIF